MRNLGIVSFFIFTTWNAAGFFLGLSTFTPDQWGFVWFLAGFALCSWLQRVGQESSNDFATLFDWTVNAAHREGLHWWVTALLDLSRSKAREAAPGIEYKTTGSQVVVGDTVATMTPERDKEETGLGWDVETKTKEGKKIDRSDKAMRERAKSIGLTKF